MSLSDEQLELLIDLTEKYQANTPDLNQREWAIAESALEELQRQLDES